MCPGYTQTDRQTERRRQNYYTRHVTDVGCKKTYALKTPHVVFLPVIFPRFFFRRRLSNVNGMSQWPFWTSWPWPLTYDLDPWYWPRYPSTWPPCLNSSLYVCLFGRYSETDTHTDTHNTKTITPITSETWGIKRKDYFHTMVFIVYMIWNSTYKRFGTKPTNTSLRFFTQIPTEILHRIKVFEW